MTPVYQAFLRQEEPGCCSYRDPESSTPLEVLTKVSERLTCKLCVCLGRLAEETHNAKRKTRLLPYMSLPTRTLILPGWLNSGPGHWQSRWELQHGFVRVQQSDWDRPLRGDWMACLEEAVLDSPAPVAFVAHSLGCQLVAAWAEHSQQTHRVAGALLVAPPDTARDDMPAQLFNWRRISSSPLPFAAHVLFSEDDPFCAPQRAQAFAADWQVPASSVGRRGHINGESGLGDWPEGLAHLHTLMLKPHG